MNTIYIPDSAEFQSGACEAVEFFMANKRCTQVQIDNKWFRMGQPVTGWKYKGPRNDVSLIFTNMESL